MTDPLTPDEKQYAFLVATRFFDERYGDTASQGMTDEQLTKALQDGLGRRVIWGGPGRMSGACQPDGLKIYAERNPFEVSTRPIFAGRTTLAMARVLYNIPDPDEVQQSLF